ncbi:MAG: LLM class flavin-dependent oxidoreductase [Candidatus Binataceae bacterium]|nr:LLM class flavin-dependent oxidoreductase [Candidatus Binataceae bacterium]
MPARSEAGASRGLTVLQPGNTTEAEPFRFSLFSTAPQSAAYAGKVYAAHLAEVARWSEEAGCSGILIYSDNRLIDPWIATQIVLTNTARLCPLVAVQPAYMHPYSVARMVTSLAYLYGRRIYLNMIAGGFRNDLTALCDETPHDQRYARISEYTSIIQQLLTGKTPVTFAGDFYRVKNLSLQPLLPSDLMPGVFVSGSSPAGMKTAAALNAVAVEYPKPGEEYPPLEPRCNMGIRIGIIAAETDEQAWQLAQQRFPADRKGQIRHALAMKLSDSQWHKQLSAMEQDTSGQRSVYWLWPFKNYNTFCPYLVGGYETVSNEISKYMRAGFTRYILDIPLAERDLHSCQTAFRMAAASLASADANTLSRTIPLTALAANPPVLPGAAKAIATTRGRE